MTSQLARHIASDRALDAVIFGLAAHRVTRLVTKDTLTAEIRDGLIWRAYGRPMVSARMLLDADEPDRPWIPAGGWSLYAEQDDDAPKLATLVVCRWCASMHVSLALLVLAGVWPKGCKVLVRLLALSSVATLVARVEK